MRHDTIASFLQKKNLAKIFTYGSLAARWRYLGWSHTAAAPWPCTCLCHV